MRAANDEMEDRTEKRRRCLAGVQAQARELLGLPPTGGNPQQQLHVCTVALGLLEADLLRIRWECCERLNMDPADFDALVAGRIALDPIRAGADPDPPGALQL